MSTRDDWIPILVIGVAVVLLATRCDLRAAERQPTPQQEARALTLTEAEGAALATPPDPFPCYQERRYEHGHVCITENEWKRQREKH